MAVRSLVWALADHWLRGLFKECGRLARMGQWEEQWRSASPPHFRGLLANAGETPALLDAAPVVRVALVSVFLFSAESTAASPDEPTLLFPLVVKATRDQPATGGTAALATVTPLEANNERLADLFQRVPGLIAQDGFGGFDPPRLAVRGSGIQSTPTSRGLVISCFGMPLNAADGSLNLALLESAWFDFAALIRGPAAGVPALGGSLSLGSVADGFAPGWAVKSAVGSDDSFTLTASGTDRAGELDLTGRAAYSATAGWRPHSAQERESVFAATRGTLGDDWELTVQLLAVRPWYEVPGPLTKSAALNHPTAPVPAVLRDDPRRETEYVQFAARASKRWDDAKLEFALGGSYQDDLFYQLQANGVSETAAMETYLAIHGELDWNARQVWNLAKQRTAFAALLQAGWWDANRYRNDSGHQGKLIGEEQLQPLTLTAAIDHRLYLTETQQLECGISTLTAVRDIDDRLSTGAGGAAVDLAFAGTRVAPRLAWSWSPVADTTFVVSYARSYEPPTYNDLLFTAGPANARVLRSAPLDWQRADSFELAVRGRYQRLAWSSALYYAPWRGEFLRLANEDGSSRGTVNADRTLHSGWENSLEWELLPSSLTKLTCWATYNYTDARFDDDPVYGDGRLAGVPPHTGALGLRAVLPGGWFIAPGCQWRAGETYGDHAHDLSYGGSGLWSLELGRRHPDGWTVSLGIHNLFDRKTIASTAGVLDRAPAPSTTAIFLPAAGRTVAVRVGYEW